MDEQPNRGDPAAICREVYHEHRDMLMRYLRRRVRIAGDREDIHSDVWTAFLAYVVEHGAPEQPGALLRKIADCRVKDWYTRQAKAEFCPGHQEVIDQLDAEQSARPEPDQRDGDQELAEAVKRLRQRQKLAVYLHYYQGLGVKEVATAMGIKPNTAKEHIAKALKALRTFLGGDNAGGAKRKEVRE